MSILDISKTLMYDFHYNAMKKTYPEPSNIELLYTDTDSLTYTILTYEFYSDMRKKIIYFDTSDYPPGHKCFTLRTRKSLVSSKTN